MDPDELKVAQVVGIKESYIAKKISGQSSSKVLKENNILSKCASFISTNFLPLSNKSTAFDKSDGFRKILARSVDLQVQSNNTFFPFFSFFFD